MKKILDSDELETRVRNVCNTEFALLKASLPVPQETKVPDLELKNQLSSHQSKIDSLLEQVKADLENLEV